VPIPHAADLKRFTASQRRGVAREQKATSSRQRDLSRDLADLTGHKNYLVWRARRWKAPWVSARSWASFARAQLWQPYRCAALDAWCARRIRSKEPKLPHGRCAWRFPLHAWHGFATRGARVDQVGVNPPRRAVVPVGAKSATERRAAPGLWKPGGRGSHEQRPPTGRSMLLHKCWSLVRPWACSRIVSVAEVDGPLVALARAANSRRRWDLARTACA
jgi:hypothetical protein